MNSLEPFLNRVISAGCVSFLPSLPDASIDFVCTDPPYLVDYRPRDGRRCAGDDTVYWLRPAFRELYRVLKPDSFCATFYGWPWVDRFMSAWRAAGFRPVSHLVWVKSHCSREGYAASFHETGFLLAKGKPPRPDKPARDVLPWEYTGNMLHPNEKPVLAVLPLIEAYSKPGDVVLDPFAGSGTMGVAARSCSRRFILVEKASEHADTARRRLHLVP